MAEFVRVERDGAIATIRLDRSPMNALSTQVQDEIAAAAGEAGADPAIRAVVVYGGGKVFAAGADIKELASASYPQMAVDKAAPAGRLHGGREDPQAGGGGGDRLRPRRRPRTRPVRPTSGWRGRAPASASRRSCSGSSRVRAAPSGCPAWSAGEGQDIIYTGRFVPAVEAREIGLVDKVVPDGEVYQAARDMAARYAVGPALALRAAKQAIDDGLDAGWTGLEIERLHFSGLFATEDRRAGMRSFIENGPGKATFTGR